MCRLLRIMLIVAVALSAAAPSAGATPTKKLDAQLGALWTAVLETPSAQNSFGTGGEAFGCWSLGGTVAPFGPTGVSSCTVKPGTRILVAASSFECSSVRGDHGSFGTTDAELRTCARQNDLQSAPPVTVDGRAVQVREVETALLEIVLPADNLFGATGGDGGPVGRPRMGGVARPVDAGFAPDRHHDRPAEAADHHDDPRDPGRLASAARALEYAEHRSSTAPENAALGIPP